MVGVLEVTPLVIVLPVVAAFNPLLIRMSVLFMLWIRM